MTSGINSNNPTKIQINGKQADTTGIKKGNVEDIKNKIGGRILPPTNTPVKPTITKTSDLPPPPVIISPKFDPACPPPIDLPPPCPVDLPQSLPSARVHQKLRPLPQPGVDKKPATKPGAPSTADQKPKKGVNKAAAHTPPKQVQDIQKDKLIAQQFAVGEELNHNVQFTNIKFEQDNRSAAIIKAHGYIHHKDGDYWLHPDGELITRDTLEERAKEFIQGHQIDPISEEIKKLINQGYFEFGGAYYHSGEKILKTPEEIEQGIFQEVNILANHDGYTWNRVKGFDGGYTNAKGETITARDLYIKYLLNPEQSCSN